MTPIAIPEYRLDPLDEDEREWGFYVPTARGGWILKARLRPLLRV